MSKKYNNLTQAQKAQMYELQCEYDSHSKQMAKALKEGNTENYDYYENLRSQIPAKKLKVKNS